MTSYYAQPVPGSAGLKTRAAAANPELASVEGLEPGRFERHRVLDQELGRVAIRADFVPVLKSAFDSLARQQTVVEQVVYLQLYRHAYGEERNFCRLPRVAICQATGLSVRRFNVALAGLVQKRHIGLVQRNRQGTLYRIFLPHETAGLQANDAVFSGKLRNAPEPVPVPIPDPPAVARPALRPSAPSIRRHKVIPVGQGNVPATVGSIAGLLLLQLPAKRRAAVSLDVLQEVTQLAEEGHGTATLAVAASALKGKKYHTVEELAEALRGVLGDSAMGGR